MKQFLALLCLLFVACGGSTTTVTKPDDKQNVKTDKNVKPAFNADEVFEKGITAYKAREYETARMSFTQAASALRDSKLANAYKFLGFIMAIQNNHAEATKFFLKAFDANSSFELDPAENGHPAWTPDYVAAATQFALRNAKGSELAKSGKEAYAKRDYETSINFLEQAVLKTDLGTSDKVEAYKYLGFIYALKKRNDEAKAAFQKAFQLNKNFELDKSEYGNPTWTPLYDEVKKSNKK